MTAAAAENETEKALDVKEEEEFEERYKIGEKGRGEAMLGEEMAGLLKN